MDKTIQDISESLLPRLTHLRREIHRTPELAFEEHQTSALICRELKSSGIPYTDGVADTGVVARIQGTMPGPTILLRADLDALPINENTSLPFASEHPGVMHACGHDMHVASLLGCAFILQQLRPHLRGTVRLVFQPAEERLPGGALEMIRAGVLDTDENEAAPSYCIAQHVQPTLKAGTLGFRPGTFMASADELYITITAEGGHAAAPHNLNGDPVLAAAHVITALQSIVSRNTPSDIPAILSIGRVEANGATNVIPSCVQLEGTFRSMDEAWRASAHQRIYQVITQTAQAYGAYAQVDLRKGYPMLSNDSELTQVAHNAATLYVGKQMVKALPIWMVSEDFAYFTRKCPSLLYTLGVGPSPDLHTSEFCPDESSLCVGAGFMAFLTLKVIHHLLKKRGSVHKFA